ncbi:DedA family protein/thiosulfate sulfurtransferase GlpE [Massilia solisilvae]|uniref:DedA family protein/thiosulfate sulfurtransferase GlpE n=1 Tax=Massilia solisilvae TaxID=1811225 RepID=A0ABT2BIJ8_9BURK|nr:DedA family protein/thiosulfate sulfurtransferase GlpE [Massilia solisilvae]MCS0608287.1 DedA family protein/thiosulfate sulfurtransferase GlpE [Massilia solisilvae]
MSQLAHLIQTYGLFIVFGIVLLEQAGLPIPAMPVLIVAGALAVDGQVNWALCLVVSVAACLVSDYFWFRAGRYYGKRILRLLCRISLAPDSCVGQTEDNFSRFGPNALVVAKFIPGLNTVAPPLAGAMGTTTPHFLALSVAGASLWSGVGVGVGAFFHDSVDGVLSVFESMGTTALEVVLGLLALFMLYKYAERRRVRREMAVPRIDIEELRALIDGGHDPVIIDARGTTARQLEAAIPGALVYLDHEPDKLMATLDHDRHIVVYCSCPNDVTAAQVAKEFLTKGFHRARPLQGGLDAWNAYHALPAAPAQPCGCPGT